MTAITPDWKPHMDLETDANEFLDAHGFRHGSATYHNVMPAEIQSALIRNNDPTSLYIRTRADRLAVHSTIRNCAFQYECKTAGGRRDNMAVEAIQLAQHVMAARLGVRSLYIYRDTRKGIDCGFWNTSIPTIAAIHVPDGHEGLEGVLAISFPNVEIRPVFKGGGSGDPYCLIEWQHVAKLKDWRHLIADFVAAFDQ